MTRSASAGAAASPETTLRAEEGRSPIGATTVPAAAMSAGEDLVVPAAEAGGGRKDAEPRLRQPTADLSPYINFNVITFFAIFFTITVQPATSYILLFM